MLSSNTQSQEEVTAADQEFEEIPVIDIGPLVDGTNVAAKIKEISTQLGKACLNVGFFYIKNHGIEEELIASLFSEGHRFFREPVEEKQKINMKNSNVFRGWFELGGELTSKKKDWKEGLYFGAELDEDAPEVVEKLPMHGVNQWPDAQRFPGFDKIVLSYMSALTGK